MTTTTNSYSGAMTILGTSTGRQVHLAWGKTQKPLCGRERVTNIIASLDDNQGQEGTIDALLEAKVAHSRLCGGCFYPRFRAIYRAKVAA